MHAGFDLTNKRGADALIDDSLMKRARMEGGGPSKTLHIRNLPQDCTEQELMALGQNFGRVTNVMILKGKTQGFIQLDTVEQATACVAYYTTMPATVRGKTVYLQFSNREEISATSQQAEKPNFIILITIQNVIYPITLEVLHEVFGKYGDIAKIVIFNKEGRFQTLVQYTSMNSAMNAKAALDGQNIYSGCCTLRIQYSNLTNITVKFNNDKSRDYTNPSLPSGNDAPSSAPPPAPGLINTPMPMAYFDPNTGMPTGYSLHANDNAPSSSGSVLGTPGLSAPPGLPGMPNLMSPYMQFPGMPGYMSVPGMAPMPLPVPPSSSGSSSSSSSGSGSGTPVIIVSGLSAEPNATDLLFTLFGVYGDVIRVKILYNKRDTALVQMANAQQAELVVQHLNNVTLHGSSLQINLSKHQSIGMPRPGQEPEGQELTKDFTGSALHRYKGSGSRNAQHICAPTPVLHLSNLPAEATEELIKALFAQYGTVKGFKFFQNDRKMALIQMNTVGEAVDALVSLHNYQIGTHCIRVSFSKNTLAPRNAKP